MRLFEAMIDANHRAVAGDTQAGLHPAEFASELPLVALTCIDTRLNALLPEALGVPGDEFIWLRNAGNIITSPLSSTMRSLALACAVKGGKEIAIIGHTDCQVAKTGTLQLLDKLRVLGVERHLLPDNVNEYFGIFSNERENIIKGVALVRSSPLIGPKIPVHGLLVDIVTGKVDWLVNGYETLGQNLVAGVQELAHTTGQPFDALKSIADFKIADLQFPESKIGELATTTQQWLISHSSQPPAAPPAPEPAPGSPPPQSKPPLPPKIPMPPPIRPRLNARRNS